MDVKELDAFEAALEQELLKVATGLGKLSGTLLASEDIDVKWKEYAPEYLADAVKNVNDYPEFAVGCAAFAGMAVAHWWDQDWGKHHSEPFAALLGPRGFDDMDDHIVWDLLAFAKGSTEEGVSKKIVECLSTSTWTFIRHSSVESGTRDALLAFERACRCMFRIGASIELKRLGYRYHAVPVGGRPS